jgi:hypothetical protein
MAIEKHESYMILNKTDDSDISVLKKKCTHNVATVVRYNKPLFIMSLIVQIM